MQGEPAQQIAPEKPLAPWTCYILIWGKQFWRCETQTFSSSASIQTPTLVRAVGDYRENREGQTLNDNMLLNRYLNIRLTFLIITTRSM